jgi:hypothetical protein
VVSRQRLRAGIALAAILAAGAAGMVWAQPTPSDKPPQGAPILPPDETPPQETAPDVPPPPELRPAVDAAKPDAAKAAKPAAAAAVVPPTPPVPPKPLRSPAAILQALDKVTAETMRFEAPVGKRIRYKTLVFTVKACETTGLDDPQPQSAAYLIIESEPRGIPGHAPPPSKQVFKGWMFSTAPGRHPMEHPVYDAWLIACSASAPPA